MTATTFERYHVDHDTVLNMTKTVIADFNDNDKSVKFDTENNDHTTHVVLTVFNKLKALGIDSKTIRIIVYNVNKEMFG